MALRRRPARGLLAGLWEYPNELSDGGDWPARWGIVPVREERGGTGRHIFTHIEWHMTARVLETEEALPPGWVWADGRELRELYALPNAFRPFTRLVEERLR